MGPAGGGMDMTGGATLIVIGILIAVFIYNKVTGYNPSQHETKTSKEIYREKYNEDGSLKKGPNWPY
jgi:hypothetical protein